MIVRNTPNKNFTVLRNEVMERTDLSLKAKGLYAFLMTKPDGWQVSVRGLEAQLQEGKDAIRLALLELSDTGYYKKEKINGGDGKFTYKDYFYDSPRPGFPVMDKPTTVKPVTVNPPQVNTNRVNTKQVKTDKDSLESKRLALLLNTLVSQNYEFISCDEKTIATWAKDIRLIHTADKFDYKIIEAVIQWSQADTFWRQNIRSGSKLRKQFTSLLVRIKDQGNKVVVIS